MFPDVFLDGARADLTTSVRSDGPPSVSPLPVDSWLARSVMQKAIRRGMVDLALRAASQLLVIDSKTLWRRLLVTALEDLGPPEFELTAQIVAASADRRWRASAGGDWAVIANLVRRACEATKCQSANDLWNIALHDETLDDLRSEISELTRSELLYEALEASDLDRRAIATLLLLGESTWGGKADLLADPSALTFAMTELGNLQSVIYARAHRLVGTPLGPLALGLSHDPVQVIARTDDNMAPVTWSLGLPASWTGKATPRPGGEPVSRENIGVPTFALDQYTRPGKAVIRAFASYSHAWIGFCETWGIAGANRMRAAGEILFRIDGAVVVRRALAQQAIALRKRSAELGCFMPAQAVATSMVLLRRQLPHIDKMRARLLLP